MLGLQQGVQHAGLHGQGEAGVSAGGHAGWQGEMGMLGLGPSWTGFGYSQMLNEAAKRCAWEGL